MRGLTIAGMILVTDPGTYSAVFPPLLHAAWQGATPTDMIFPTFLFMVGISIVFSTRARLRPHAGPSATRAQLIAHIALRALVLIVLGLLINGFPTYDLHHLRIPGILQRIALCYAAAALLYLAISRPAIGRPDHAGIAPPNSAQTAASPNRAAVLLAMLIAVILIGYWALLRFFPVPGFGPARYDSLGYLGAYIDRAIFTTRHLWAWGLTPGYGVTYDPEGLLSTLPALANTLLGMLTGVWLRMRRPARGKVADLLFFGTLLVAVAWPLAPLMPINKRIWTSTFALLSGGVSLLALGLLYWFLDLRNMDLRSTPRSMKPVISFARIFGTNAILAFVFSSVLTASLDAIHLQTAGGTLSLHRAGYQYLFAPWLPPRISSLAYALAIVALNAVLLYPLYRKRIFLRI
jgi:predicted acyltransferase